MTGSPACEGADRAAEGTCSELSSTLESARDTYATDVSHRIRSSGCERYRRAPGLDAPRACTAGATAGGESALRCNPERWSEQLLQPAGTVRTRAHL